MTERRLTITRDVDDGIRAHGQETYPHECCGALVGTVDDASAVVYAMVKLPNTTEEGPRRRFLVRPSDYREAEKQASALGGELLGFYHSHPDHPARPSQYDLDHAWPTFAYIIVAVAGQSVPGQSAGGATAGDMTVWYLNEDRSSFDEGRLHHGENTDSHSAPAVHR